MIRKQINPPLLQAVIAALPQKVLSAPVSAPRRKRFLTWLGYGNDSAIGRKGRDCRASRTARPLLFPCRTAGTADLAGFLGWEQRSEKVPAGSRRVSGNPPFCPRRVSLPGTPPPLKSRKPRAVRIPELRMHFAERICHSSPAPVRPSLPGSIRRKDGGRIFWHTDILNSALRQRTAANEDRSTPALQAPIPSTPTLRGATEREESQRSPSRLILCRIQKIHQNNYEGISTTPIIRSITSILTSYKADFSSFFRLRKPVASPAIRSFCLSRSAVSFSPPHLTDL